MTNELRGKNKKDKIMGEVIYGVDGNQYTAYREDFINLQESHCGFGDTNEEALKDLLRQEKESYL